MKQRLERAEDALRTAVKQRDAAFYPHFHLAPPAGWMNDPNGLIYHQGRYHAFYQHHPFSENWGPMHWGHATSPDMVHWQHQPIALAPGEEYDRDGCFSGSAVDDNGVLSLIYTGHVWLKGEGNDSAIREVQCLATSDDGIHFTKQGVVLTPPPGIMHFRDPKVWREGDSWWMVIGARDADDRGQVLLYRGSSLRDWQLDRVLAQAVEHSGYMWECPDFFALGEEHLLICSPQGIRARGYDYRNLFQSGYLRGEWQPGDDFVISHAFSELDHGHDFYAPQSFLAADGRRIIIAWMDMWESVMPSKAGGWAGCMTLPRELRLQNDRLRITPVAELTTLRRTHQSIAASQIHNRSEPLIADAGALEIITRWDLSASSAESFGLKLGDGLKIAVDSQAQRLTLQRHYPQHGIQGYRSVPLPTHGTLELRIFIDSSSVEVFVNQGEATLSSRIWPEPEQRPLALFAENGQAALLSGDHWTLAAH
ncbi:glycoside hydrolase family 32 protein [Winslowiella iniecta]|uniref:Sucrose-6-phosphate hydrolase n=1 Tax=Winslowiella iniecta TaxID=1560201 RepID=A0A0L7T566_9GAMM|nr:glycoside hydrolase family 32 protein [Winslowiella iniecta]KOC90488.1 glycosyl hydrolase family 32 [Winslowiella iniecta]KOC93633.1 glycosyl hydrolase family 32 [Winslowiella iniecta]